MLACQIHEAKAELLSGEKELAQIAKDCGFAHQSHFTSRFKQATGLTPTRWRRMAQQRGRVAVTN
jgi:AraC family transcriptional regulator